MIMDRHGAGRPSPAMVLFDIAGTLVGDTGLTMSAYRSVLEDEGMPFDAGWLRDRIGCQKLAVFAELLRMHDRDVVAAGRLADRFASSINASIMDDPPPVLPGVHETFSILHDHGCGIGLVTGFHASTARCLQEVSGWSPDVIVGSDEVAEGRPAPDLVLEAMRRFGIERVDDVAVVGDTPRDLMMASAAGCGWGVGVSTGPYTADELRAHPHTSILASMEDLPRDLDVV